MFPSYYVLISSIEERDVKRNVRIALSLTNITEQELVCKLKKILEGRCSESGWQQLKRAGIS